MQINEIGRERESVLKELLREEDYLLVGIEEKKRKLENIRKQINVLKGNKGFPWTEKAIACITNARQLVSTDEILKWTLFDRVEDMELAHRRKGYITALSVSLNKLKKAGKVNSYSVKGIKGNFYGLPEWWNENGLESYYKIMLDNKINKNA